MDVGSALAVGRGADPFHGASGLQIDFQFGSHKQNAVGFGGYETLPDFLGGAAM